MSFEEKYKIRDSPEMFAFKNKTLGESGKKVAINLFPEVYGRIIKVLDTYMDMNDKDKKIVALWIIGTYFYKDFPSFPRLFINAMKGSGKSRLLQIIKALSWRGTVQTNLTEAVLFRNASERTLLFDESESISSKEKGVMRELLNAGYKKGVEVTRMKKVKTREGEEMVTESFDLYGPVGLANINGLEDVLQDRSITIILEKSNNPNKTKLIEDFDGNMLFLDIKRTLELILVYKCSVVTLINSLDRSFNMNIYTLLYTHTYTYNTTLNTPLDTDKNIYDMPLLVLDDDNERKKLLTEEEKKFYKIICNLDMNGRNLELFFPLFIISYTLGKEIFDEFLDIAKNYVIEKNKDDHIENRDWSLINFVSKYSQTLSFRPVFEILNEFRDFYNEDNIEWINSRWMGRALKRLNLTIDKRRLSRGIEYILNSSKAREIVDNFKGKNVKDEELC